MQVMECVCKLEEDWDPMIYFSFLNFRLNIIGSGDIICKSYKDWFPIWTDIDAYSKKQMDSLIYHLFAVRFVKELYDL